MLHQRADVGRLLHAVPMPHTAHRVLIRVLACLVGARQRRVEALRKVRAYRAATSPPLPADRLELPSQTRPPTVESGQMSPYDQDAAECGLSGLL